MILFRILWRGSFFLALAVSAYLSCLTLSIALALFSYERVLFVSWLDVGIAFAVAFVVGLVPSSRLRALPVLLVCIAFPLLRQIAVFGFLELFNFGPGAYPLRVLDWVQLNVLLPRTGLVFRGIVFASLCASLPKSRPTKAAAVYE